MLSKSLPDRILVVLPTLDAPTVSQMAARLQMDQPRVRAAFDALEASGRAKIVRRGNGLHLVPHDYHGRICPVCRAEYRGHGRTCSKSCGMRVAWTKRDRAKQAEVFREAHRRQPERFKSGVDTLRNNPAHRAFVAKRNREDWADPVKRMKRVIGMETAWKGPNAAARVEQARKRKSAAWEASRDKLVEGMRTGTRGRYQRALIAMVAEGAEAEEIAARTGRTIEQTKVLWRRCFRQGWVDHPPADGRKMRPVRPKRSAHV